MEKKSANQALFQLWNDLMDYRLAMLPHDLLAYARKSAWGREGLLRPSLALPLWGKIENYSLILGESSLDTGEFSLDK